MASPFNPFAGLGQKTGATGTAGRGQSTLNVRSAPFHPRGSSAPRGPKYRGRGRGAGARSTRGPGRDAAAAGATGHPAAETAKSGRAGSPFAQPSHKKSFSALFGGQTSQQQSPFAVADGTTNGTPVNGRKAEQPPPANTFRTGPEAPVPVEGTSVLNRYHERYEQVSNFLSVIELEVLEEQPPDNPAAESRSLKTTREGNQGWTDGRPEPAYLVEQSDHACRHLH